MEPEPARAAQKALAPIVVGAPAAVGLTLESPDEGSIFSDSGVVELKGSLETLGEVAPVDAVVVLDTSASTGRRAGGWDPVRARHRAAWDARREPPSILEQEIRSIEWMLGDLDPEKTRLGVVTFAGAEEGEPADGESAWTEVPLTAGLEALDAGLQRIERRGAFGRTDMAAGLDRAVEELTGKGESRPSSSAAKVIVFMTDGTPTLPYDSQRANREAVFEAADRAAEAGVRVFAFAIGPDAVREPEAAAEMARRTDGVFTPVRRPQQLAEAVRGTIDFETAGGELKIRNATLRANAQALQIDSAGRFAGVVPLRTGKNRISIRAEAGEHAVEVTRSVHYAPGSVKVWIPPAPRFPADAPTPTGRALEIATGQRRSLELELGDDRQQKEVEIGVAR